jgi:hypothetical protein
MRTEFENVTARQPVLEAWGEHPHMPVGSG